MPQQLPHRALGGYLGMMAKFGPLARRAVCAELRWVVERLFTHLPWLVVCAAMVGGATMLVAVEEVVAVVEAVDVVGAMGAAVVVVTVSVVVLLVWLLNDHLLYNAPPILPLLPLHPYSSCLSHTAVKPDSHSAWIFCHISLYN